MPWRPILLPRHQLRSNLMEDFFAGRLVEIFEVRNFQGAHGLDGCRQGSVRLAAPPAPRQVTPRLSQCSKDLRPIESLAGTMLTKAHCRSDLIANITEVRASRLRPRPTCHTFPSELSFL